jgi:hypothetical protein
MLGKDVIRVSPLHRACRVFERVCIDHFISVSVGNGVGRARGVLPVQVAFRGVDIFVAVARLAEQLESGAVRVSQPPVEGDSIRRDVAVSQVNRRISIASHGARTVPAANPCVISISASSGTSTVVGFYSRCQSLVLLAAIAEAAHRAHFVPRDVWCRRAGAVHERHSVGIVHGMRRALRCFGQDISQLVKVVLTMPQQSASRE